MAKVRMSLEGLDGNAFSLLGTFTENAKRQGWSPEAIEAVRQEAMAGDYVHLLQTLDNHIDDSLGVEMRIFWGPLMAMEPFTYPVPDMETASVMLAALAQYDSFRHDHPEKKAHTSAGGAEWRHPVLTGGEWVEFDPDDASDRMELAAVIAQATPGDGRSN